MNKNVLLSLLGCLINLTTALSGAPGSFDSSFGTDGRQLTEIGTEAQINALALRPDGKIIAAGYAIEGGVTKFAITRYNSNGSLDDTFGTLGITTTTVSDGNDAKINGIVLQPDGKILVTGRALNNSTGFYEFALARYTEDGILDTTSSFGTGSSGITLQAMGTGHAHATAIKLQDSNILLAGYAYDTDRDKFALARFTSSGILDSGSGFGDGGSGKIITTVEEAGRIYSLDFQSDGKIIVAGWGKDATFPLNDIAIARYTTLGVLDATFAGGGIKLNSVSGQEAALHSLIVQSDDTLLASGYATTDTNQSFVLARYNASGSLTGTTTTLLNEDDDIFNLTALTQQSDGKSIIAGYTYDSSIAESRKFALARYTTGDVLDSSFGSSGIVITNIGSFGNQSQAFAAIMQTDDKVIAAGYGEVDVNMFGLARFLTNATPSVNPVSTTTTTNTSKVITISGSDTDLPAEEQLQFSIASGPSHGTLSSITNTGRFTAEVTYTPTTGYSGSDSFTYQATDGQATSPTATVSIDVNNSPAILIAPHVSTLKNNSVTVTLEGTDTDSPTITYSIVSMPMQGTLSNLTQQPPYKATVVYTPNAGISGTDTFSFKGTDTHSNESTETATINILNQQPTANDNVGIVLKNNPTTIVLSGSDPDLDPLHFFIDQSPSSGTLSSITQKTNTTATVTYTPTKTLNKNDSFTFYTQDGDVRSTSATVLIKQTTNEFVIALRKKYFPQ